MNLFKEIKEEISKCIECSLCMEQGVCPSYDIMGKELYSPLGRLSCLNSLIKDEGDLNEIEKSLLTCNGCARCTQVCPEDISIGELVSKGRNILYKKGIIPKEAQKRIINSILNKGNAVGRKEEDRIIYKKHFYDELFHRKSDTLLFLGCISSFFHPDAVSSSIQILEHLGVSFRLLKNEGCCGIFLYDGGYLDKAEQVFKKNRDIFLEHGIKKVIVLCPSCYKCFRAYYPEILKDFNIEIFHFIEIVAKQLDKGKDILASNKDSFVLHEPCKITRFMKLLNEPREVLNAAGIKFSELGQNREVSFCCGAGNGVRAYDMELALQIARGVLIEAKKAGSHIITICPFCTMNFNHASKKYNVGIKAFYISEILL